MVLALSSLAATLIKLYLCTVLTCDVYPFCAYFCKNGICATSRNCTNVMANEMNYTEPITDHLPPRHKLSTCQHSRLLLADRTLPCHLMIRGSNKHCHIKIMSTCLLMSYRVQNSDVLFIYLFITFFIVFLCMFSFVSLPDFIQNFIFLCCQFPK